MADSNHRPLACQARASRLPMSPQGAPEIKIKTLVPLTLPGFAGLLHSRGNARRNRRASMVLAKPFFVA